MSRQALPPSRRASTPLVSAVPLSRDTVWLLGLGVLSLAGYLALRPTLPAAGARDIAGFAAVFALLFALYIAGCALVLRGAVRGRTALLAGLALAAAFRLLLAPQAPTLSGDAYRYVWDARLLAHGLSPYLYTPLDPHVAALRDAAIYPHMGWYFEPTLYPPAAQYVYLLTRLLAPDNVIAIKIVMLGFEAVTVAGLMALLQTRGQDPARVLIYAWNPLAVVEIAGNGHVDATAAAMIVLALLAQRRGRPGLAGVLIGLATLFKLFKLFPLALLAALDRRDLRRAVPAALVTVAAGYLPFLLTRATPFGFLGRYAADQEANQWLYVPAHLAQDVGTRHLLHLLPIVALVCALALLTALRWRGRLDTATAAFLLLLTVLLFSPSMYPWYLLTVLPFVALGLRDMRPVGVALSWGPGTLATLFARPGSNAGTGGTPAPPERASAYPPRIGLGPALYLAPLLFSATVAWSYAFYELNGPLWWLGALEYVPLYGLLALAALSAAGLRPFRSALFRLPRPVARGTEV